METPKKKFSTCSPKIRERAVRMVLARCGEHASQWVAVESVAGRIGWMAQTLCNRVASRA